MTSIKRFLFDVLNIIVRLFFPNHKITQELPRIKETPPELPKHSLSDLAVLEARNDGREDGVPCTIVFASVPNLVRYYVNYWKLGKHKHYVFIAYSWSGKLLWQEVYTYGMPMYDAAVWAKHFPLSRLDAALRADLVRF